MNWLALFGLEGLAARWRGRLIEVTSAAEDRMQLACLEWKDLKRWIQQLLVLIVVLAVFTVVLLMTLSFAVLVHFWDRPERMLVAWLVASVWAVGWAGTLVALACAVQRAGQGLALTRRELAQDWHDIKEHL